MTTAPALDETHAPDRRSWVGSANGHHSFPIQNLPFGVFSDHHGPRRVGVAIGDRILDLTAAEAAGLIEPAAHRVFGQGTLNPFMALGAAAWTETRKRIADLLCAAAGPRDGLVMVAQAEAQMHLPAFVRSFTDFYSSRHHAANVGAMFRDPERALTPNWLHMPVAYNARASTVVVSGTPIRRPLGQLKARDADAPRLGACERFDFELELGTFIGTPSEMGRPLSTAEADAAIFGHVLLNDWSARDIQVWEAQPLGPFQSKACGTTISPWVVTTDALRPFRTPAPAREKPLLPYLAEPETLGLNIALDVAITPEDGDLAVVCETNAAHLYYTPAQQLAHHALSGCAMETGDLFGSGTISGPEPASRACLLERTMNGAEPVTANGLTRAFLLDGDTVTITGRCDGPYQLGFGPCAGTVLPAPPPPGAG